MLVADLFLGVDWDGMIQWIDRAVTSEFVSPTNAGIIVQASAADEVVRCLKEYKVVEGRMHLDWSKD
jgi:predicted Rossmann-fold nucleotide-binding protein